MKQLQLHELPPGTYYNWRTCQLLTVTSTGGVLPWKAAPVDQREDAPPTNRMGA